MPAGRAAVKRRPAVDAAPSSARLLVGLADGADQSPDGSRRPTIWIAFVLAAVQLGFGSLLRLVNLRNQIRAVRCLRAALIVFGPKLRQMCLHSVPIIRPVEILYVQDKPDLETRVGAANSYAGLLAQRHRFVKARVFVAVEYGPDLVAFLEIIQRLAAAAAQTEKPRY